MNCNACKTELSGPWCENCGLTRGAKHPTAEGRSYVDGKWVPATRDADLISDRPWTHGLYEHLVVSASGVPVASTRFGVDAAHIVHCVNVHEMLVAALEEAERMAEALVSMCCDEQDGEGLEEIRAALAAAKEGK